MLMTATLHAVSQPMIFETLPATYVNWMSVVLDSVSSETVPNLDMVGFEHSRFGDRDGWTSQYG